VADGVNRRWTLVSRPVGMVGVDNFHYGEEPRPQAGEGQCLVQTLYVSLDPAMRGWLNDRPSYVPPVAIGAVMRAGGVGRVVESYDPTMPVGSLVTGLTGWQEYIVPRGGFQVIPDGVSPEVALGALGATGMTAYFGLFDVGKLKDGETVVVSGAAGAVGSLVGQLAKIKGCRVVGIAGSPEKCAWVVDDLGFDACVDYQTENVGRRLRELCPEGVDVYFDNVGGPILDQVLVRLNLRGRIVLCGAISTYNATEPRPGPAFLSTLIPKRGRMEGFIVFDYADRYPEAIEAMGGWLAAGTLKARSQVVEGLEKAPQALLMLFDGANTGKLVLKVAE